ncbi:LysR substrate-binding domain-containing protein [Novosphingobium sp. EMRT-2]|uniref:LysR substrate-binding domain-containing protein n=1 Tax=Novosphingobium sp. EMRT-2 TaxID=2571749 RepID=UPI0021038ABE|nr:LysR substrate-binding domain-containing protein [Novosphingobium sp. EMRT-2]
MRQARCHKGREKGIGRLRAHPSGNSVAILQAIAWPLTRIGQIAALKDGRIDVGFGRVRFEDATVQRTVLREEHLVVAIPAGHRLAGGSRPLVPA